MNEDRTIPPIAHDPSVDDSGIHDLRALAARCSAEERVSLPELLAPQGALAGPLVAPREAPLLTPSVTSSSRPRSRWIERGVVATLTLALSAVTFAMAPRLERPRPETVATVSARSMPLRSTGELRARVELPVESVSSAPTEAPSRVVAPAESARPRAARVPRMTRAASVPREPAPTPAAPAGSPDSELDRLLEAALNGTRATSTDASLPATPTPREVTTTLRAFERRVASCREDDSGTATARVVIEGATGRVRSVVVTGVGTETAACLRDLVETATFAPFEQSSFAVTFPYRL